MAGDPWVFGYGSLMWRPGFPYLEARPALLRGYHRCLCIYSHIHRGTPERPGLVLGLDGGGSCRGMAFRVDPAAWEEVRAYLVARELPNDVYLPKWLPVRLPERTVEAWTFVTRRAHAQYAGRLAPAECARLVRQGEGISGPCADYLANTVAHLDELGIGDGPLHQVLRLVRQHQD